MALINATEGQALWKPGGAEEDSCLREGNGHLRLDEEECLGDFCFFVG